jgi:hypothetical protein
LAQAKHGVVRKEERRGGREDIRRAFSIAIQDGSRGLQMSVLPVRRAGWSVMW